LSEEPDKKKRLWQVDPTMYRKGPRAGFFERRVLPPFRQAGKFLLIGMALTYPLYLVYVGLVYGGIAFWAFFAGSFAAIAIIISKLGYAGNFRQWDIGLKKMAAVMLGFLAAFAFYAGLVNLKTFMADAHDLSSASLVAAALTNLDTPLLLAAILFAVLGLYFAARQRRS